jgi:hypothetical protein
MKLSVAFGKERNPRNRSAGSRALTAMRPRLGGQTMQSNTDTPTDALIERLQKRLDEVSTNDPTGELVMVRRSDIRTLIASQPSLEVQTDGLVELCQQLRRNTKDTTAFCPEPIYRNPDGPKAADAIEALQRSNAEKDEALRVADEALRAHACHGGPNVPCVRAQYQCQLECGKQAGDALVVVSKALSHSSETQDD